MKHEEFKWLKEKIGEEKTEELLFKTRQAIWSALLGNGSIGDEKDSSNTRAEMIWDMAQDILSGVEDTLASSEKKEDLEKMRRVYSNLILTGRDGLLTIGNDDDPIPFSENGNIIEAVNAYLVEHGKEPVGWRAYSEGSNFDKFWSKTVLEGVYFFVGKDRKGYFVCFAKDDKDPTWVIVDKDYIFH